MTETTLAPIDLHDRLDAPEVRELVSYAVGFPTAHKLDEVMRPYEQGTWTLVGLERYGQLIACLGYERLTAERAAIRHIAVAPEQREHGIGRALLRWLQDAGGFTELEAETDADAVDFYRKYGFNAARFVDPRYPDAKRWRCILASQTEAAAQ
jgi:ribosomal protein S18 acetylase RimI-like enzyme